MKKFILAFYWSKTFKRNLYYCNKRNEYFYLGHFIPNKCCTLIKEYNDDTLIKILLNQLK